eukprot:6178557-Pleurochrysis_carterae.AAC.1
MLKRETSASSASAQRPVVVERTVPSVERALLLSACGGLASCTAKTCVAPLDRVKLLSQVRPQSPPLQFHLHETLSYMWIPSQL